MGREGVLSTWEREKDEDGKEKRTMGGGEGGEETLKNRQQKASANWLTMQLPAFVIW